MENINIFDMSSEELFEAINVAKSNLMREDSEYKALQDEMLGIIKRYPNIDKISDTSDTDDELELTKEECKMLQKVVDLHSKTLISVFLQYNR